MLYSVSGNEARPGYSGVHFSKLTEYDDATNGVLWDMSHVYCGIYENGLLYYVKRINQWIAICP